MRNKNPKRPSVECSKCKGVGYVQLSPDLHATLLLVEKKRRLSATEAKRLLDQTSAFSVTAFNNRLAALMDYGFIKRERNSRHWVYSPA